MAKSTVENRIVVDGKQAGTTMKDLKAEIRQTSKELDSMTVGTEAFNKKMKDLAGKQSTFSDYKKEIKDMSVAQGAANSGLIDYVKNVRVAGLSINGLSGGIKGSIAMLKSFKVALAATGIGAIVLVLGTLIQYLTKTQAGIEIMTKVTDQASAAFDVIMDRILQFGGGIAKLLQGDWKEGLAEMQESFKGVGDEMQREVALAGELAEAFIALEKKETDLTLTQAKRRKLIEENILASKNEQLSIKDRVNALEEANDLELANMREAVALQEERVRLSTEEYDRANSTEQDRAALVAEQVRLEDLKTNSYKLQTRLASQLAGLQRKLTAETVSGSQASTTASEEKTIAADKELAELQKVQDFISDAQQKLDQSKMSADERELERIDEHYAAMIERAEGHDELEKELEALRDEEKDIYKEEKRIEYQESQAAFEEELNMMQLDNQGREIAQVEDKYKKLIAQAKKFNIDYANLEKQSGKEILNIKNEYRSKEEQEQYERNMGELESARLVAGSLQAINETINGERGKSNAFAKATAIFQIAVSTSEAIAKATAASMVLPYPRNIIATVVSIATVAANIAQAKRILGGSRAPKYATGGLGKFGGVPRNGQLHAGGGIHMIDSASGQMVGEMERDEPYLMVSRNTYRNNRDVLNKLIDSSLHRGGAPIFATGMMGNPASGAMPSSSSVAASASTGGNQELLNEMRDMNASIKDIRFIKAIISSEQAENELDEREKIRAESQV